MPSQFANFEPVIAPVISVAISPIFPGSAVAPVKIVLRRELLSSPPSPVPVYTPLFPVMPMF